MRGDEVGNLLFFWTFDDVTHFESCQPDLCYTTHTRTHTVARPNYLLICFVPLCVAAIHRRSQRFSCCGSGTQAVPEKKRRQQPPCGRVSTLLMQTTTFLSFGTWLERTQKDHRVLHPATPSDGAETSTLPLRGQSERPQRAVRGWEGAPCSPANKNRQNTNDLVDGSRWSVTSSSERTGRGVRQWPTANPPALKTHYSLRRK